jgi:oligopeptide transport system substrate-binding protein
MKRTAALILCFFTLLTGLAGCAARDDNDRGPIISAYIAAETFSFDPAQNFTDDDTVKILGLIYEGLTKINSKGKLEYALLDNYKVVEDELRGEYKLLLELKKTKWNDGTSVTANDVVFAWKRILNPDFSSPASALLYDIKNARDVKSGDASIDDLGISAVDTYTIEVTFEAPINPDGFLRNLSSIALVPLRENLVSRGDNWAKKTTGFSSSGPFAVKNLNYDAGTVDFDRNAQYYLKSGEDAMKYVFPYRFTIKFLKTSQKPGSSSLGMEDLTAQLEAYNAKSLFYLGDLPLAARAENAKKANATDINSTLTYLFNTTNKLFSSADVRKALSMAIDRAHIAELLVFAKPATGIVPYKVYEGSGTKSFRSAGKDIIATTADIAGAKALLSSAGVTGGSFSITYKATESDTAVAEYIKGVWQELGFTVTLKPMLGTRSSITEDDVTSVIMNDDLTTALDNRDFDVLALDLNSLSVDAFPILASFAKEFSGMSPDKANGWALTPGVTGFDDAAYSEIITRAYNEKDLNKRAQILHEAEEYLVTQMPAMPVVFNQDYYLASRDLSKIASSYYGWRDFKKTNLKNYLSYYPTEE